LNRTPAARRHHFRQTKVENFRVTALGDKNVRWLDVAVDDALRVSGIERVGNLDRQTKQNIRLYGSAGDPMFQRNPVKKLHNKEWMAMLLSDLMEGADIGVIECRSRLGFALEPRQGLSVLGDVIGQKLQHYKSVESYVLGLVDNTHSAATRAFRRSCNARWFGRSFGKLSGFQVASSYGRGIPPSTARKG
jgi:hypothetical protein